MNEYNFSNQEKQDIAMIVVSLLGQDLYSYADLDGIMQSVGYSLSGNEDLSEVIQNAVNIHNAETGEEVEVSLQDAKRLASSMGYQPIMVSSFTDFTDEDFDIDSELELEDLYDDDEEDDFEEEDNWEDSDEEWEPEEVTDDLSREEDTEKSVDSINTSKEDYNKIKEFYYQFYKGIVDELCKRYTSLFASGYEVLKPAGMLSKDGIVALSGNSRVVKSFNADNMTTYKIFKDRMNFVELDCRSNVKIADVIYDEYFNNGGSRLLYFPNKMLEFAYGRKAPLGDNKDSTNTYEPHSDSSNWSAYSKKEVIDNLKNVIGGAVVKYVVNEKKQQGDNIELYSIEMADSLKQFLLYLQKCLSTSLLMVDYSTKKENGYDEVASFKVRVCDPEQSLGINDIGEEIVNKAYGGGSGVDPMTYDPRFEMDVFVKEYAHEFNHAMSQASPLFSYKAFLALQQQGLMPTWENMVLGKFEDGTILKNGVRGIAMSTRLTHHIPAGSRAGKGVMTLNMLASAILSNKALFYFDDKPDMASLIKYLCGQSFAINGADYNPENDSYGTFANLEEVYNRDNIPSYLLEALNIDNSWLNLGDIFYMRALKLVLGIIMARGEGNIGPELGGEEGVVVVVDEFKNFQEGFKRVVDSFLRMLPPRTWDKDKAELDKLAEDSRKIGDYNAKLKSYEISYNNGTYYALSYINSLSEDMNFLSTKRDAGFNPLEVQKSDIFVIGQHINFGACDNQIFSNMIYDKRYRQCGRVGLTSMEKYGQYDSIPYSLVSFKTSDAFFGRNMDDGRSVYLAQTNPQSKAFGRLDDKASNFAYIGTYTEDIRKKIVNGNVRDNIEIANSATYFKPFLILNDCKEGDTFTEQLFARCAGDDPSNPWITREELINLNPNDTEDFLNPAIGFEEYLNLMGANNYKEVLTKGAEVADYIVQKLGYPGSWFDFITDLRPEWMFTIKDISSAVRDVPTQFSNPESSTVLKEFFEFNPQLFGGNTQEFDGMDPDAYSEFGSTSDFMNDFDDFSNEEAMDFRSKENFKSVFGEDDYYQEYEDEVDEELNLFDEDVIIEEEDLSKGKYAQQYDDIKTKAEYDELEDIMNRLKAMGLIMEIGVGGWEIHGTEEEIKKPDFGKGRYTNEVGDSYDFGQTDETVFDEYFKFNNEIDTLATLIKLVTTDVLDKFGGYDNIKSFKVIGGSIVINGYFYSCSIKNKAARGLPYDVRREINSGNIAKLFDFSQLKNMHHIRDMEFDSANFVYDYVSLALGYGNRVSVDLFFEDFNALQVLTIKGNKFRRETLNKQLEEDDTFYQPKKSKVIADASEKVLGDSKTKTWNYTKKTMSRKDAGLVYKTAGVILGTTATVALIGTGAGVNLGRKAWKGIKNLGSTFKDAHNDFKNMK